MDEKRVKEISTPQEFKDYDGSYDAVIVNNIDMSGIDDFTPIPELTHELDGRGFTISNLTLNDHSDDPALIKVLGTNASLHNINVFFTEPKQDKKH